MNTCLGKSYSFGLLFVFIMEGYQFVCVLLFPFGFEDGMGNLIVLVPDHCLTFYFLFN